ncbi:MAG: hypothetical protein JWQ67_1077, partial [Marmoricola sp.]|nr:hypothetical protein [Marmoricola sp.]
MIAATAALFVVLTSHSLVVGDDETSVNPEGNGFTVIGAHEHQVADPGVDIPQRGAGVNVISTEPRYAWRNACDRGIGNVVTGAAVCPANACAPDETQYRLWKVAPPPARPLGLVCSGGAPPPIAAALPQVTDAMVLAAFRRVPLPSLRSHSQPADKTLINFDTIFFTEAEPLTRQVTLLGQNVRLEITPS